jgi:transposase-like protein
MAHRGALTEVERQFMVARHQAGARLAMIALELGCSRYTIRKWWRRHQRGQAMRRRGRPAHGILSTYPAELVEEAIALKRSHPHWGPANVKLELKRDPRFGLQLLPSDPRLSALFKARCPQAVQPHRSQIYPGRPPAPVHHPHERWQIDGKENVPVGAHEVATILDVRDPAGALMIISQAILTTTPKGWRKVTQTEVQETLRTAFTQWGMPLAVQTDHEVVYTGKPAADFPTDFTLWLVGLGLEHTPSRDRRPTDQSQVEREHRTLGDMGFKDEPSATLPQLQALLDDRRARYNQELPVHAADCEGQPPLVAHPHARHSGRPFSRDAEWELFQLERVDAYLARFVWIRKITATGDVSVGSHPYYVGRKHLNQTVSVRFVPATRAFRFQLADGTLVNELPAVDLEKADLIGYLPLAEVLPIPFQIPLPLAGV